MNAPLNPAEILRAIAIKSHPDALWDTADVAAYLCCSPHQLLNRFRPMTGFPKAIRLPSLNAGETSRGNPRWKAREIIEWASQHQEHA